MLRQGVYDSWGWFGTYGTGYVHVADSQLVLYFGRAHEAKPASSRQVLSQRSVFRQYTVDGLMKPYHDNTTKPNTAR